VVPEFQVPADLQERARQALGQLFDVGVLRHRGPLSVVFQARDLETNQMVALKVMPRPPAVAVGAELRFQRDAAAAASLRRPHIVPVLRHGVTGDLFWYAMQYVDGRSLGAVLRERGSLSLPEVQHLIEQASDALDYAHRRGILHGAIKPANVLVDTRGWAMLTDFATCRILERVPPAAAGKATAGLLSYLAPEELWARQPGPAADQYALAVTAYECLCGRVPFAADSVEATLSKHASEPPPLITDLRPDVPEYASEALRRAMSKEAADRFPSVLEFANALMRGPSSIRVSQPSLGRDPGVPRVLFVDELLPPRRRTNPLLVTLGLALPAILGGILLLRREPRPERGPADRPAAGAPQLPGEDTAPPLPLAPLARVDTGPPLLTRPAADRVRSEPARRPRAERRDGERSQATSPVAPTTPQARPAPAEGESGLLFVNSTPWGQLFVDGELLGNTPRTNIAIAPGTHRIRVVREGFEPYERTIEVAAGQRVRLTDIVLQPLRQ
jgi:serine/threonine-protein kinase